MEIGVDSFAAALVETSIAGSQADRMRDLLQEIEHADQVGLDVFGVGEHHRKEFLPNGALLVDTADEVAAKILRHSEALGGISRITFMMNGASLPHLKLMSAIDLIASRVAPVLRDEVASAA
jgi:hypothetical protein